MVAAGGYTYNTTPETRTLQNAILLTRGSAGEKVIAWSAWQYYTWIPAFPAAMFLLRQFMFTEIAN